MARRGSLTGKTRGKKYRLCRKYLRRKLADRDDAGYFKGVMGQTGLTPRQINKRRKLYAPA